jgi:hypothetical protein
MKTTGSFVSLITIFLSIFFFLFVQVFCCKCPKNGLVLKEKLCQSDFAAVVNITGKEDSCDPDMKCVTFAVLSTMKGASHSVSSLTTPSNLSNCGLSLPNHGIFIVSGSLSGTSLQMTSCSSVFKKVLSAEGPAISEHKDVLNNC